MRIVCCFALLLAGCHTRGYVAGTPTVPVVNDHDSTPRDGHTTSRVAAREETPPAVETESSPPPYRKSETESIDGVNRVLEDIYFAYDRSEISSDALAALQRDAELLCDILAEFPGLKVIIEGHCDERGSAEYNLALGDRRARRAEEILRVKGVPAGAAQVVSYGKEAPQCTEPREACYQQNRRAHLSVKR